MKNHTDVMIFQALRNGDSLNIELKKKKEERVVEEMIALYCHSKHSQEGRGDRKLCQSCQALRDYAIARSEHCPFMEHKTFCANCKVHCYKKDMRQQIRDVMRFSGPRMLMIHPCMAIWHIICSLREKKRMEKE